MAINKTFTDWIYHIGLESEIGWYLNSTSDIGSVDKNMNRFSPTWHQSLALVLKWPWREYSLLYMDWTHGQPISQDLGTGPKAHGPFHLNLTNLHCAPPSIFFLFCVVAGIDEIWGSWKFQLHMTFLFFFATAISF